MRCAGRPSRPLGRRSRPPSALAGAAAASRRGRPYCTRRRRIRRLPTARTRPVVRHSAGLSPPASVCRPRGARSSACARATGVGGRARCIDGPPAPRGYHGGLRGCRRVRAKRSTLPNSLRAATVVASRRRPPPVDGHGKSSAITRKRRGPDPGDPGASSGSSGLVAAGAISASCGRAPTCCAPHPPACAARCCRRPGGAPRRRRGCRR